MATAAVSRRPPLRRRSERAADATATAAPSAACSSSRTDQLPAGSSAANNYGVRRESRDERDGTAGRGKGRHCRYGGASRQHAKAMHTAHVCVRWVFEAGDTPIGLLRRSGSPHHDILSPWRVPYSTLSQLSQSCILQSNAICSSQYFKVRGRSVC